jgi:hypothetical protein
MTRGKEALTFLRPLKNKPPGKSALKVGERALPRCAEILTPGATAMNFETVCWILLAAYAVHVLEEFALNWRAWANWVLKLPVDWPTFYVTNSVVVVLGIVAAKTAGTLPLIG